MTRSHPLHLLLLGLLLVLPAPALAQVVAEAFDPIAATVLKAEQDFRRELQDEKAEFTKQLKAVMDRSIQSAVAKGDLDELESLQAQLKAYETDGTYPSVPATRSHILNYNKRLIRLGDVLVKAYETATRQYTQARDVGSARLMKEKILWTRPTYDLDTHRHNNHLYMVVREKKTWRQAKAEAEALGGYLACLADRTEARFIVRSVTKGETNAWLGGTDAHQEGDWVWLDGEEGYWPWAKNEPNNVKRKQHHAAFNISGTISDLNENDSRVNAYLVEWDTVPTRETVYQTEAEREQEAKQIATLKSATLKHNDQIVAERKRLQTAIVDAQDEQTLTAAKTGYNARVSKIKKDYIAQLEEVLTRAVAEDRLEIAGNIKAQILRVKTQLARLDKPTAPTNVPALDDGDTDPTTKDPPPAIDPEETPADPTTEESTKDTGTFFGLPLE